MLAITHTLVTVSCLLSMTVMTVASNNVTWSVHGYCVSLCRHATNMYGLMSCQLLFPSLRVFLACSSFEDVILRHVVSQVLNWHGMIPHILVSRVFCCIIL